MYTCSEVMDYVAQEDVKFIRLAFCDCTGKQKNIAIMPNELQHAFQDGISFDGSAVTGFDRALKSDLLLFPDPSTLAVLPWRPAHGRVVRMFCSITYPDGTPFERDGRACLCNAMQAAQQQGISCSFGPKIEFYLFKNDENGVPTEEPFDTAGYMDIAPEDKGENVRRDICLYLQDMGIVPESSHHEEGPGQNKIDFQYGDALTAADNATTFKAVVKTVSMQNGLYADFSPKPLAEQSGNGFHINISVKKADGTPCLEPFMAGIMAHICEITSLLNPVEASYKRLGQSKAPRYVTWSKENRSQLIRIPASKDDCQRMELRSPDPQANPYLAFALLIYAGLDGVKKNMPLCEATNVDLFRADKLITENLQMLPGSLKEARRLTQESAWVRSVVPQWVD